MFRGLGFKVYSFVVVLGFRAYRSVLVLALKGFEFGGLGFRGLGSLL